MLKKTITYTDFNGDKVTEDLYFNLSKFELTEMQVGSDKGYAEELQDFVDTNNARGILMSIKEIILKAYGVKSEDGKRFIKKDADGRRLADMFEETAAFSEVYMELINDDAKATEFILGVVPADMAEQVSAQMKTNPALNPSTPKTTKTTKSTK